LSNIQSLLSNLSNKKAAFGADNRQKKRLLEPPFELVFYGIHTDW